MMLILELYEGNTVRHHYFMLIKAIIFLPFGKHGHYCGHDKWKPIRIVFGFQKFDKICISNLIAILWTKLGVFEIFGTSFH